MNDDKDRQMGEVPEPDEKKPWPMSWILILILAYIALQTGYFLFFSK